MHISMQSITLGGMPHIKALAESGCLRCSCCGSASWDPPQLHCATVDEVRIGGEHGLGSEPPRFVVSINCSRCGKRESFDYHRLAAYSKTVRGSLGRRLARWCVERVKSVNGESPFNPALSRVQQAKRSSP